MCRPVCSVPITLIMVLHLATRKGIFASYFYPCTAAISNLQCQESQRKKKSSSILYNNQVLHGKNRKQVLEESIHSTKIYNYEYFLFSVKINCAIKRTILKSMKENHTIASWLIWSINFLFCAGTNFLFCFTDRWGKY